jgi:hypothetical protein
MKKNVIATFQKVDAKSLNYENRRALDHCVR